MKILVLGGEGMLGHKIYQVLAPRFETWVTFRGQPANGHGLPVYADARPETLIGGVDALDFDGVTRALHRVRPDAVVNCIGIVKQLREAHDPILSLTVNALLPHRLAKVCGTLGARLVHVSTDCVFSGRKGMYVEADQPDADDLYGRSKLLGEVAGPGCLTLRTSIFGRDFLKDSALLEWFLSNRGGRVTGYRRAVFSGFPTRSFARIVGDVIERHPDLSGLYHLASPPISKLDLLTRIREALRLDVGIDASDGPACDRSLDGTRFLEATGCHIPGWDELIADLAADRTPYDDWKREHRTS